MKLLSIIAICAIGFGVIALGKMVIPIIIVMATIGLFALLLTAFL